MNLVNCFSILFKDEYILFVALTRLDRRLTKRHFFPWAAFATFVPVVNLMG